MKSVKPNLRAVAQLNYATLNAICDRAFFMALMMIHKANHRPQTHRGEPKVGGHATACASSQHILGAIHLVLRNPEDYFACKPHVSPIDHAFNFLLHNFRDTEGNLFDIEKRKLAMHHLRHYSPEGEPVFQSYHAESDPDSYRYFPSGSVGIPPVNALYTNLAYEFTKDHGFQVEEDPYFWCLMGDSEFREGSLMEAMPDGGDRELKNQIWIVDYNRQNLDGTRISNEEALGGSDADRIVKIGIANGWNAIKLKHGKLRESLFQQKGGEELRRVLDEELTDFEFQALIEANDAKVIRKHLEAKSSALKKWLAPLSDEKLKEVFFNLAGHDLESLVETFSAAKKSKKPTLIVAYTIKGRGLECQARSGNHSTLPEEEELATLGKRLGLTIKDCFLDYESGSEEEEFLSQRREFLLAGIEKILKDVKHRQQRWLELSEKIEFPEEFDITALKMSPFANTQWMWGQVAAKMDRLAHTHESSEKDPWASVARYFLTMAPDVGTSTNTSPNMNGKLYGDIGQTDFEKEFGTKDSKAPDVVPSTEKRSGHIRFEIAEGNCMSAAGSFGKFFYFVGIPFFPAMTIYDFFIKRAHDQFYYNLYWRSNFAVLGTPCGVTLSSEGAQHSWKSDFQIPHCVTWEPCFAKELDWILADTLKRHFTQQNDNREASLIRCVTKGLAQKDFLARVKTQARFLEHDKPLRSGETENLSPLPDSEILNTLRKEVLAGGYRLIHYEGYEDYTPGDNVVHMFAMGALGEEAILASDALLKEGIYANVFIVTSPDLLLGNLAEQSKYTHLTEGLGVNGDLHLQKDQELANTAQWLALQGSRIPIVSVHDGEPGLLDNIGSIVGVKHQTLAVRRTSKSGFTKDIYHFHHIDAEAIAKAAKDVMEQTAAESLSVHPTVLKTIFS